MPSAQDSSLYTLLRYHLGWTDRYGRAVAAPVSQGKALRPTLCLFACEALDGDLTRALPAAAALELIHNFSLIHDDIQDRDLERRHQPTVWHLWGVARGLVAGDAMQGLGDLALLNTARLGVSSETSLKVSQLLTEGCLEMIQGQCLDLEAEARTSITTSDYLHMIACKTGALIRTALVIGALLATDDPASSRAFARFGNSLGRVFQIRDDYLGIWGDEATTGKATGNDIRRRKKSFPVVFALERATGRVREDLLKIYSQPSLDEDDVARVLGVLDEVGAAVHAQQLTEESARQSLRALEAVSLPAWARAEVEELVDFLARREY
jgi:geranylgeranyl diphosphate synthase type I